MRGASLVTEVDTLRSLLSRRRSVRGFRPELVPADVLQQVFTMAAQAPSNCNVQPWIVHVVSGDTAERLRAKLYESVKAGAVVAPDYPLTGAYPGEYRTRQVDAAKALFSATGVARDDVEARTESFLRNFRFFDAPHAAFIMMPDWAEIREAADCGMYAQSLMLAMAAHGIGSCAQGALGHHGAIVRDLLGVADGVRVFFGIAFGYEDEAHPANAARTSRVALDQTTRFHN
ncbi:MAG: nitroreductase [Sphingobium sp.]